MKNKIALIFGATGQDGFYLDNLLSQQGVKVIKTSRNSVEKKGNVSDYRFVEALFKEYKPHFVFHLAANSSTRHNILFENHETISTGTLNILECAKLYCPDSKIFLSGSAMQFKNEGLPINEETPFEASSPYSVARIQSVYAGRYYRKYFGLKIYVGYFFNHDSPLRSEQHINQKIIRAARQIARGNLKKLTLGNIEVKKEFNYAGDIVEAVWKLVNQENVFEVVIGSGKAYQIKDWLEYCFYKMNLNWESFVILKQDFVPEYQVLVSNPQLILNLGWQPKVDFYQLANMMINEHP